MITFPWKALIYSSESECTISDVKKSNESDASTSACDELLDRANRHGVGARIGQTAEYPFALQAISSAPYVVYYVGNTALLHEPLLSIVGPRKPSVYAQTIVTELIQKAAEYRLAIVSGGAEGIDRLAHESALSNSIPTIAILGCGLRRALAQHSPLLQKIRDEGGLILSQRKLDQQPTKRTFPARNKIVAGLGECLFVPAAGMHSGTVISIDFALQMGKHVYAVPNSVYDAGSEATNTYIAEKKIHAVVNPVVVLEHHFRKRAAMHPDTEAIILDEEQRKILEIMEDRECTAEQLASELRVSVGAVLGTLSVLEVYALVHEIMPGVYKKY